ncbi:flagellar biosynthesis protein FlhF [Halanaerobium saccharolyticum]|uniref:Flagellar biosynthesis protein FlhF n=1 Tax=Halanaerobium saccharolyticum TaxID=43595 RepID=A0A4R6LZY7_9FIRM|nr:flagellar biosynthesis protein FlhF [Halanaerobium saccharolyticum]TDO94478.1 flagellar biosynthesis protein FlhF [Halanaerobium saccharolyticum]
MKVKKYTGETMQDVIFQVKADLGPEAVIVNKRKFKKGGLFGFFGREMFEVVAALEAKSADSIAELSDSKGEEADDIVEISNYGRNSKKIERTKIQKTASKDPENKNAIKEFITDLKTAADSAAEKKNRKDQLDKEEIKVGLSEKSNKQQSNHHKNSQQYEENQQQNNKKQDFNNRQKVEPQKVENEESQLTAAQKLQNKFQNKSSGSSDQSKKLNNSNQLYNYLLDQGVDSRNVNLFLKQMDSQIDGDDSDFENQLKEFLAVYFADNGEINLTADQKIISFIGPTGVGKTTTMAKIAAHFAVDKNKKVGLITADTYRIAAVEQLQTYSKIIDIPFAVCYSSSRLEEMIRGQFRNCDLILIDTPGSSWKDQLQLGRLKGYVDHSFVDQVHLLLSLNTKSSDLRSIVSKFSELEPDRVLLTKLDETSSYGDIINIKENYNLPLSYLTFGQDVPEDLEAATADQIYKYLFGDFYA